MTDLSVESFSVLLVIGDVVVVVAVTFIIVRFYVLDMLIDCENIGISSFASTNSCTRSHTHTYKLTGAYIHTHTYIDIMHTYIRICIYVVMKAHAHNKASD